MITQRVNRTDPEAVFITVENADGSVLVPGTVVQWRLGTNATQPNGHAVQRPTAASVNVTSGLAGPIIAGVVHSTISTDAVGLLQVYGRDTVRASASYASGRMMVAYSINGTNIGHVTQGSQSTLTSPEYFSAVVGWQIDDGPNATNATLFLQLM